jgi:hypothetical protein
MKFKVSVTYSEVTPESASNGDFSETGFVSEDQIYTLRELIDLIKSEGYRREGRTDWMTNGFYQSVAEALADGNTIVYRLNGEKVV